MFNITFSYPWLTEGVDFNLAGNGGFECLNHVSLQRRWMELAVGSLVSLASILLGFILKGKSVSGCQPSNSIGRKYSESCRTFFLVVFSFTFGLEVSYKFSTKQLVFLLNPCHVMSAIQIYLIGTLPNIKRGSFSTALFLCSLHWFHGPLTAIVFPVTNTRLLPFEPETYWVQHLLLVIVPFYLMLFTEQYSIKKAFEPSRLLIAYGIWGLYHWMVLLPVSVLTWANVGSMLCPSTKDPFYGENYRLHGIWHQLLAGSLVGSLCSLFGKTFYLVSDGISKKDA